MTIKEFARITGVSISTISKIMNGKDDSINYETRERILNLAKEYHYGPYATAGCNTAKSLLIGVIFDSLESINIELNGALCEAQKAGYQLLLFSSNEDASLEYKHIRFLADMKVDGVLWRPVSGMKPEAEKELKDAGIPYLFFHSHCPHSVNIDFQEMGYHATKYLLAQGHTAVGCLLANRPLVTDDLNGYKQCLFDHGIAIQPENIYSEINETLLNRIATHSITAMFISHYTLALDLFEQLQALHYSIPYDISLISLRDDFIYIAKEPSVSSITVPHYDFGAHICRTLIAQIEHNNRKDIDFHTDLTLYHNPTISVPYTEYKKQILTIGSIHMDHYLFFDSLPKSGETAVSSSCHTHIGGKGLNQAVGASLLGHNVSLIGAIGNDISKDLVYAALRKYNINPAGILTQNNLLTGQAYIFLQQDGNSTISITPGANSALTPEKILEQESLFQNTGLCLLSTELPAKTIKTICQLTQKYHTPLILKPSVCTEISDSVLRAADYFIPNELELNSLCPAYENIEQKTDFLLQKGVKNIIVTLGPAGCYLKNQTTRKYFPAVDVQTIDATGACDAFISAFASYLLYGYSLEDSISIATYAAALSTTKQGVIPSLTDKNSLELYMQNRIDAPPIHWKN